MDTTNKSKEAHGGFTLIELLVSVAIISLLVSLFITNFDRATSGNRLATDAEVFQSKVEQTRLLAGSTQQVDELLSGNGRPTNDDVGYYGIYLPLGTVTGPLSYLSIVSLSDPLNTTQTACLPVNFIAKGICQVDTIPLSQGVTLTSATERIIAFRAPTQELFEVTQASPGNWKAGLPTFTNPLFSLKFQNKIAKVSLDSYTGHVQIAYQ